MKRFLQGILIGIGVSLTVIVSIGAFAQDRTKGHMPPLIVDIRQAVPILADIVVPLDNGSTITTTVPFTANVALQISLSGIVDHSVQIVGDTEPSVTIAAPTSVPPQAVSLPTDNLGIPYRLRGDDVALTFNNEGVDTLRFDMTASADHAVGMMVMLRVYSEDGMIGGWSVLGRETKDVGVFQFPLETDLIVDDVTWYELTMKASYE